MPCVMGRWPHLSDNDLNLHTHTHTHMAAGSGVLPAALAASSGRHAEPSPGKSGAREAGPGRRWRPPGTLGLWAVGTALRESARSGSTLMVPGENPELSREPRGGEWLRARDPAGDLAERGARFLSVPLSRPRPSGSGMGGGVFRPFLSQKLFLLQPARGQYVGEARARDPGEPRSLESPGWGGGAVGAQTLLIFLCDLGRAAAPL